MKKIFTLIIHFLKKHPIIANLIYISITGCIIVWATLLWLNSWTGHGVDQVVPDIKGLDYAEASKVLSDNNLQAILTDSVFNTKIAPGLVIEQTPKAGTTVKPNRSVYVTINAYSPRAVTVPNLTDISLRQARSIIEGLGIKNIRVVEVPSEYKNLVMCVKYNGLPLSAGMRIPVTASVTIEVGKGYDESDSIHGDIPVDVVDENFDLDLL